jgi:hypothetical protein
MGQDESLTYRAPMHYPTNQTVVFTFEGMEYGRPAGVTQDLSQVQFIFNGKTNDPVAVSNEVQSVSYLINIGGGKEYTLTTNSFLWPTCTTNWMEVGEDYTAWHTNTYHTLSWTNFHNETVKILEHDVGWGGRWGYGGTLDSLAKRLGAKYTRHYSGQGLLYPWDYMDMIDEISKLGKWDVYVYCGHGGVDSGYAEVAGYTGIRTNAFLGIETTPGYYNDPLLLSWYVAYKYRLSSMATNFQSGKGTPRIVIILACKVEGGNNWPADFINAGAKLVVRTGGNGDVAAQSAALTKFFESLAAGGTVDQARAAGNAVINASNARHPPEEQGGEMVPSYGTGVSGGSTFQDLIKE